MKLTRRLLLLLCLLLAMALAFGAYVSGYYRADDAARACLAGVGEVRVQDGNALVALETPGAEDGLIFYPGGLVEPEAYLPLLMRLAERGVDCYLVKMPLNLAVFGVNRASEVMAYRPHRRWFLAGHSLGGSMAAFWASLHPGAVKGLILLAAFPSRKLPEDLQILVLYGSEDGVLSRNWRDKLPPYAVVEALSGGNHAGFGCYGAQKGDGVATVSGEEQQAWAAGRMLEMIRASDERTS